MENLSQANLPLSKNAEEKAKILESFANIVDSVLGDLNAKDLEGKKFSEEFQFDGVPLWWFYRRLITSHVLPKQFNTADLVKKQKISTLEKGYYQVLRLTFQKYIKYNERMKVMKVRESVSPRSKERGLKRDAFLIPALCDINRLESHSFSSLKKRLSGLFNVRAATEPLDKNNEKSKGRKKILFLTYTNHINKKNGEIYRLNATLNLLKEEKKVDPFILFADPLSTHSYQQIKKLENTIYQYIGKEERSKAELISRELHQKWASLKKEEVFGVKWGNLQYTLNFFFSQDFIYNTILYYLATKRVLQEQSIQGIVITATTGFFERGMIAAAAKLNIPLVIIQHGEGLATCNPELFPDMKVAIAVFGEMFAKRLVKWGIDRKDIELIGPVAFEEIYSFVQKKQKKTDKILLITTSLIEGNRISKEAYFEKITSILRQLSLLQKEIVIKLHPAERYFDQYTKIIKQEGLKNVIVTQERGSAALYRLVNESDLVINLYSTVALQAMILGKPVVSLDIVVPSTVPNVDEGIWNGGMQITMDDDITKAAAEALQDPPHWKKKRKEIVELYCYKVDGKENERLRDLIYRMSGSK